MSNSLQSTWCLEPLRAKAEALVQAELASRRLRQEKQQQAAVSPVNAVESLNDALATLGLKAIGVHAGLRDNVPPVVDVFYTTDGNTALPPETSRRNVVRFWIMYTEAGPLYGRPEEGQGWLTLEQAVAVVLDRLPAALERQHQH